MSVSSKSAITMQAVNKWYGNFHVLRDINLDVKKGERIVICGPSGSGKSTMIRCINRLEEHQQGDIIVDGIPLTANLKNIDDVRREVGMVFQHFNLFPHLTVLENLTLAPMWVRKQPKAGILRLSYCAISSLSFAPMPGFRRMWATVPYIRSPPALLIASMERAAVHFVGP